MELTARTIKTGISKYFDFVFFFQFLFLLASFYYFNIFYIAITDPQGRFYSPFLQHHLNYVAWIRNAVLYTSNWIVNIVGIHSYVVPPYQIRTIDGAYVEMVYDCIGLGFMSFWLAFVLANKESAVKKIKWSVIGILIIWIINSCRIALLLTALEKQWKINSIVDHHTLYNLIAYCIMLLLVFLFTRKHKEYLQNRITT